MPVRSFAGHHPQVPASVYVDPLATVIGDVVLGEDCSVWPNAVVRGDMHRIRIGARVSIQDGAVLHITHAGPYSGEGCPLHIGDDVTIGHQACLHGCRIADRVLIGIGATVLDNAIIESEVVLGAGSLVPPGKVLQSGWVYMGSPAKPVRELNDAEREAFTYNTQNYKQLKQAYIDQEQT